MRDYKGREDDGCSYCLRQRTRSIKNMTANNTGDPAAGWRLAVLQRWLSTPTLSRYPEQNHRNLTDYKRWVAIVDDRIE